MVFMKNARQGAKPNQKAQKKQFKKEEDIDMSGDDFDDDDDMDSDDSDEVVVKKTPKGRQSLNEKRVSFQVPGKNTPAKTPVGKKQATPAKENSVSKKQATPGKGGIQKFKGMQQQDEDDDEDDNDDEDDSDFDGDLDLMGADDDDDDNDDDSEGDEDDDDDDDEEDDDDDEEDDDDDDDEEEEIQVKGKNQKHTALKAKQTPTKKNDKQNVQTPKVEKTPNKTPKSKDALSPKKEANVDSPKGKAIANLEVERRRQRDAMQLYLGNLPKETTAEELKALSPDIISVSLPLRPKKDSAFAFLQFESEEKAEKHFKLLKTKKFKGALLNVDYVGDKSTHKPKDSHEAQYNPKKLFISGLPLDSTVSEVAKYFPKSHTVQLNQSPTYRTATVLFWTEEDGTDAFEQANEIEVKGVKVSVLHSRVVNKSGKSKRKRNNQNKDKNNGHPAKKMKFVKKEK